MDRVEWVMQWATQQPGLVHLGHYNQTLALYQSRYDYKGATATWEQLQAAGLKPTQVTYTTLISTFARAKHWRQAEAVMEVRERESGKSTGRGPCELTLRRPASTQPARTVGEGDSCANCEACVLAGAMQHVGTDGYGFQTGESGCGLRLIRRAVRTIGGGAHLPACCLLGVCIFACGPRGVLLC